MYNIPIIMFLYKQDMPYSATPPHTQTTSHSNYIPITGCAKFMYSLLLYYRNSTIAKTLLTRIFEHANMNCYKHHFSSLLWLHSSFVSSLQSPHWLLLSHTEELGVQNPFRQRNSFSVHSKFKSNRDHIIKVAVYSKNKVKRSLNTVAKSNVFGSAWCKVWTQRDQFSGDTPQSL